jgi:hypothetical protein
VLPVEVVVMFGQGHVLDEIILNYVEKDIAANTDFTQPYPELR